MWSAAKALPTELAGGGKRKRYDRRNVADIGGLAMNEDSENEEEKRRKAKQRKPKTQVIPSLSELRPLCYPC